MVALLTEDRISLTELAKELGFSPATVWRWCLRGSKGRVLESYTLGGRRFTTRQAFERFVENANDASGTSPSSPAPNVRTQRQREADIRQAEQELEKAGA